MQNDFHRNWTPPSQLEPHIVRISPRKRLHFNATKENIALKGPPQHLSVWKDNLKRLPARNCGLLHLITTISLCHKHENTGHGHQPVSLSGFKKVLQVVRSFLWHGWTLNQCHRLQKKGGRSLKFCYYGRGVMAGWCSKCAKNAFLILCRIFDIVHNIKITFKGIRGIYYNFLSESQKVRLLYLR